MTGLCDLNLKFPLILGYFSIYEQWKFHAQLSWETKKFYNLGLDLVENPIDRLSSAWLLFLIKAGLFVRN